MELDNVQLNFDQSSLFLMNICLGFIMFGVALGLKFEDFQRIRQEPKLVFVGVLSQFLFLPAATFLFIWLVGPLPSVALGLFLVGACPGGNISNYISSLAKSNTALSISLTAIATSVAAFMTPLNFSLWASWYEPTAPLLKEFDLDFWEMLKTVFMLLGFPLGIGLWFKYKFPRITERIIKPIQRVSLVIFAAFIIFALKGNFDYFMEYIHVVFFIVLLHNGLALWLGYGVGQVFGFNKRDKRTLSIETGIQNSGLGLVIVFNFFDGLGGMAVVTAWWGIWDMIAGLLLGYFWSKR